MNEATPSQRLDKWLWHARFAKTRSTAQKLIKSGCVRIDKVKVTSTSYQVRIGHVLTLALPRQVMVVEVLSLSERRGPYSEASQLYLDHTPPAPEKTAKPDNAPSTASVEKNKRPDRRSRKVAIAMKQGSQNE